MASAPIIVADSITRVSADEAGGAVIVNASHGGVYAAYLAAKLGAAAAIFNDAGVGLDRAGIGGLDYLNDLGIAAAAVSHESARIGDGADMIASGVISHANALARSAGVAIGQSCRDAAAKLSLVDGGKRQPPSAIEAVHVLEEAEPQIWAIDSASVVSPQHRTAVVITGSHGGILGNKPETALKYDVFGAMFNDAGIGKDAAGVSRLPALDARGIAAATVAASSARIGDAKSTYEDGIVSRVNARAASLGLREGISAREFVAQLRKTFRN